MTSPNPLVLPHRLPVGLLVALAYILPACGDPSTRQASQFSSLEEPSLEGASGGSATAATVPGVPSGCVEGSTRGCQFEISGSSTYVDCFRGTQTCHDGSWDECSDGTVTKELRVRASQPSGLGLKSFSTPAVCTGPYANACDPRCQMFLEQSASATIPATGAQGIDGDQCAYTLFSPGTILIKGGTVSGNIAAAGDITIGQSAAVTVTGDVATCGNLMMQNNSTLIGTAQVGLGFNSQNSFQMIGDVNSPSYTRTATAEANRIVLWVAGANNTPQSTSDVYSNAFQNNGPAGYFQGGIMAPLVPANPAGNRTYGTWTTNSTTYSWHSATRAAIVSGFTSPVFAKCASGPSATQIPTQTINPSCSSAYTDSSVGNVNSGTVVSIGPGHYGSLGVSGTLVLTAPGSYTFDGLLQNASSILDLKGISTGSYTINLCNSWNPNSNFSVTFSDTPGVTAMNVDYSKVHWYYAGTQKVVVNSGNTGIPGVITAPNAAIESNPGKAINGIVHAQSIVLDQGALLPSPNGMPCSAAASSCPKQTTTLFDEVYQANCPSGMIPQWTYLTWDSTIPATDANIQFSAVGGNVAADVAGTPTFTNLSPKARSNTTASLDTQVCPLSGGASSCPVSLSGAIGTWPLLLRIRAQATYSCLTSPLTLNSWKVFYTCVDGV